MHDMGWEVAPRRFAVSIDQNFASLCMPSSFLHRHASIAEPGMMKRVLNDAREDEMEQNLQAVSSVLDELHAQVSGRDQTVLAPPLCAHACLITFSLSSVNAAFSCILRCPN